jgi:hypothetical protein
VAIQIPYTDGFVSEPSVSNAESKDNKGVANGYAPLDANSKVPTANLPANLVLTNDSRLINARTPTAHTHFISDVTNLQTTLDAKPLVGVGWTANHTTTNPYLVGSIVFYNHNESGVTISGLSGAEQGYNGHYLFVSRISGLALYRTSTGQTIRQTGIYNGAGYLAGAFIWIIEGLGFQKWGPYPWGEGWGSIPAQNAVETPSQGRVYKCLIQHASNQTQLDGFQGPPPIGGNAYWQELGFGFLLPNENPQTVASAAGTPAGLDLIISHNGTQYRIALKS